MRDLVLTGGRIIDPASGRDEMADIAFGHRRVTEIGRDLPAGGAETVDVRGLLVTPGLIDFHTHVYWGGTSLGVDAVEVARRSGTTTFVDAGRRFNTPRPSPFREVLARHGRNNCYRRRRHPETSWSQIHLQYIPSWPRGPMVKERLRWLTLLLLSPVKFRFLGHATSNYRTS